MPEGKRIRQLLDVSSERPSDGQILLFNKATGKWEPSPTNFDDQYYPRSEADATFQPAGSYAPDPHDHDDRYYTETEVDTQLGSLDYAPSIHAPQHATGGTDAIAPVDIGAAEEVHNHDGRYFLRTEPEIMHTRIRATSTSSPTLTGTSHGIQVGPDSSDNIGMSDDQIQARNNGNADTLYLNPYGGDVRAGGVGTSDSVVTQGELDSAINGISLSLPANAFNLTSSHTLSTSPSSLIYSGTLEMGTYLIRCYYDFLIDAETTTCIGWLYVGGVGYMTGTANFGGPSGSRAVVSSEWLLENVDTYCYLRAEKTGGTGNSRAIQAHTKMIILRIA